MENTYISTLAEELSCTQVNKQLLIYLSLIFITSGINAQDESFETSVPGHWTSSLGQLSISDDHYKLDSQALRWDWVANDEIIVSDLQDHGLVVSEIFGYYFNRFRIWIYNTDPIATDSLTIEFYDSNNTLQYYYGLQLNFTGWRAGSLSYRYDMYGIKTTSDLTSMKIKAPNSGSGTFYFDYIDYTLEREISRRPDYQLPFLHSDGYDHWQDEYYYEQLPKTVPLQTPTPTELNDLAIVKARYDEIALGGAPSAIQVSTAMTKYNNLNISYVDDIVRGQPLYGTNHASSIAVVDQYIYVLARDYKHHGTTSSLQSFLYTVRHLLDQGYAKGSLMERTTFIGYSIRNLTKAIHLMKEELQAEDLWIPACDMIEWFTTHNVIWHPNAVHSNMDEMLTNALNQLGVILYKASAAEQVQYLKGYKQYLKTWLTPDSREGEGLKVDFTGFHHNIHYPCYSYSAFTQFALCTNLVSGTIYAIDNTSFDRLKKILLSARVTYGGKEIPNCLSGRRPFTNCAYFYGLQVAGLSTPVDTSLLQAFNKVFGYLAQTHNYGEETAPNGFWQYNYANLGVYRQSEWVADIKGFNNYFYGTEIYSDNGRYCRYRSYGVIEILYPDGLTASGLNVNGWNWNMPPGTTTKHLPWDTLVATYPRQDETTNSRFAASLRFGDYNGYIDSTLEGTYGVFGMDFRQKMISPTHDSTFTFKKSVYCIDGKLICLGSAISNSDSIHHTATNLFQNYLTDSTSLTTLDNTAIDNFPFDSTLSAENNHWILDAFGTGYYISAGDDSLKIVRQNQDSPHESGNGTSTNGNYAIAYIDHGTSPAQATYEYVIIPETTAEKMDTFKNNMAATSTAFYRVLQQDATAHIIKANQKNVYAYTLFAPGNYSATESLLLSNDQPCLVMLQHDSSKLKISVVNPDMNFAANLGASQAITINLTLAGNRLLLDHSGGTVTASWDGANTIISVEAKDGLPVDISMSDIVLPVDLLNFDATCQENEKVLLTWTTANETDHKLFVVEKRNNESDWTAIGQIEAAAVSDALNYYRFVDSDPSIGDTYYRLKDIDYNGQVSISNSLNILCTNQKGGFIIYPNPTSEEVAVYIDEASVSNKNELLIYDQLGRQAGQVFLGNQDHYVLALDGLAAGTYSVVLKNEKEVYVLQLVKVKPRK